MSATLTTKYLAGACLVLALTGCTPTQRRAEAPAGVGSLDQVILYVQNMDVQVQFYRDVMGFPVTSPGARDSYRDESWVTLQAGASVLALHAGGKLRFGEDAPKLVFHVADARATRRYLLDQSIKVGDIRNPAPGVYVADGLDPEGNKFSVDTRAPQPPSR